MASNQDLIRIIDGICREKNIEREAFVADLENAIASAVRKAYETEDCTVTLDPFTGAIGATVNGAPVEMGALGRIAAQTAKQVIIQRTRERERASIFEEFTERRNTIVTGTVVRADGGNLLVNIGRTEGFLPRSEQIPGETHQPGERLRALVIETREQPNQIKVILSRSHPDFIVRLFELEVPEVAERTIEIRSIAREAGYRTKVAVSSIDSKVDAVGACVGVRGSRIKNIVDELGGEKIDIVRWNESSQILIQNALKPAEVQEIALCLELGKATVVVAEDQLSLAIGKRGQNVRLASKLTGWDIDILTPAEYTKNLELMETCLKKIEGVDDVLLDKLIAMGCVAIADVDEIGDQVGPEPLMEILEISRELADRVLEEAGEQVIAQLEAKELADRLRAAGLPVPGEEPPAAPATAGEGGQGLATEASASALAVAESEPAASEPAPESESEPTSAFQADSEPAAAEPAARTELDAPAPQETDNPTGA